MFTFLFMCVVVYCVVWVAQKAAQNPGQTVELAKWTKRLLGK